MRELAVSYPRQGHRWLVWTDREDLAIAPQRGRTPRQAVTLPLEFEGVEVVPGKEWCTAGAQVLDPTGVVGRGSTLGGALEMRQ